MAVTLASLSQYDQGTAMASTEFLASLGVKHAVGSLGQKRRGAVHEDHSMAPSRDLPEKLRDFERRRGVNHMQIFLEKLVAEILEQNGANHSVKQLIRVRELLADIIAQTQKLAQGSKGRDARELMRLREKFIMLSHADREANLPPEFRAGSVTDGQENPVLVRVMPPLWDVFSVLLVRAVFLVPCSATCLPHGRVADRCPVPRRRPDRSCGTVGSGGAAGERAASIASRRANRCRTSR